MMNVQEKHYDIGVIIGRFQIHDLHEEHRSLIDSVIARHKIVILFLGVPPTLGTRENPLDYITRKIMIENIYGSKIHAILPLKDFKSDVIWSKQIDNTLKEIYPNKSAVLYGGRDSFIPHYKGSLDTRSLQPNRVISASEIRKQISQEVCGTKDYRAGIISAYYNVFPHVYPVIDVAIMNGNELLLGRKQFETEWRFIGGFVDPSDSKLEETVKREAYEETGAEVDEIKYISSRRINDWRYKNVENTEVMTSFFVAKYVFGKCEGNDDIQEVKWFNINDLTDIQLVEEHRFLFHDLQLNLGLK